MNLDERIQVFDLLFDALQSTNSRIEKEQEVKIFLDTYPELKEDWVYILETLDGKHPIGWTFRPFFDPADGYYTERRQIHSIKDMIRFCEYTPDKSITSTAKAERVMGPYGDFLAPIVNRTLRLGIGKSLLEKSDITPMLAKKYEGGFLSGDFVVTEKDNVYYLDDDSRLMFYKESTAKKRKVADAVENMVLNSYSNILYYEIEDDTKAYATEEGSAPEIAKFDRSEIISAPVFATEGQKRTFAYIWNEDTDTFDLYYTSSGKTYNLVASDCNVADESLLDKFFESVGSIFGGGNAKEEEAPATTAAE
jgi:hypothetical protein